MNTKKTLCLDFDGVIHQYLSPWVSASVVSDEPVEGALAFLAEAVHRYKVCIFSSRSSQPEGRRAMKDWLAFHLTEFYDQDEEKAYALLDQIEFSMKKPAAFLSIDDRAWCFTGTWPTFSEIDTFKPWNK